MNWKIILVLAGYFLISYLLHLWAKKRKRNKVLKTANDKDSVVFDKAEYHIQDAIESGFEEDQAHLHIGFYLSWLIKNGLIVNDFDFDLLTYRKNIIEHVGTPCDFSFDIDGVLSGEILTKDGYLFTDYFYNSETGYYLEEYECLLIKEDQEIYEVENTWTNFNKIEQLIDDYYSNWVEKNFGMPKY